MLTAVNKWQDRHGTIPALELRLLLWPTTPAILHGQPCRRLRAWMCLQSWRLGHALAARPGMAGAPPQDLAAWPVWVVPSALADTTTPGAPWKPSHAPGPRPGGTPAAARSAPRDPLVGLPITRMGMWHRYYLRGCILQTTTESAPFSHRGSSSGWRHRPVLHFSTATADHEERERGIEAWGRRAVRCVDEALPILRGWWYFGCNYSEV